ncbi:erythromycin esterase family protein [Streptomyces sp. NPDC021093]|uniref:erythromycin esterase family protein n=1 Tax=Streptomyces sp. NPDC021093 TaxID=3365112 RepID=UPI0037A91134
MRRHGSAFLALALSLGAAAAALPAQAQPRGTPALPVHLARSPVPDLERSALPLRTTDPRGGLDDLRPLGRMVNDARVVGLGEATHSSHEFFRLKHRVFRYLVEEKGFRGFALEGNWSTGLRLNDYVLHGKGDVRRIMRDELQGSYSWWNNEEYFDLLTWMRDYNRQHPYDPVQFMGNDLGHAGPELYDLVTGYVAGTHPALLPRFTELYRGLRPTTGVAAHMTQYLERPLAERREIADRTGRALALLKEHEPAPDASRPESRAYTWALQHATAVDQTARGFAFDFTDPGETGKAMRYRDAVMAENVAWWTRHTGDRVLLAAHNGHVALATYHPEQYPKSQGSFLRDKLGKRYVSIGTTFDRGSFNATGTDGKVHTTTLGAAKRGTNEHTLDRVRHRDYVLDLRTTRPAARAWLDRARTTRSIGTDHPHPGNESQVALSRSHDILVHLHRVGAARLLDTAGAGTE